MSEMQLPATERLAQALEQYNDPRLAKLIVRAREGYYDDLETHLAYPQAQLVFDLYEVDHVKFETLVERIIGGEFETSIGC